MIDEEPRGSHYAITKIVYSLLIAMYIWLTTNYIFFSHANYQNSGKIYIITIFSTAREKFKADTVIINIMHNAEKK